MTKHCTLIESRSTPAFIVEDKGWVGRSGGYDGADESNVIHITQYKIHHLLNQAKGE